MTNLEIYTKFHTWCQKIGYDTLTLTPSFCKSMLIANCDSNGDGLVVFYPEDTTTGKEETFSYVLDLSECYIGDIVKLGDLDLYLIDDAHNNEYKLLSCKDGSIRYANEVSLALPNDHIQFIKTFSLDKKIDNIQ